MAYPEHKQRSFFKYTSAETAIKILESQSVRYSSPILFNDPFDVQSGLHYEFDTSSFPDKFMDSIEQLVLAPERPQVSEIGDFGRTILFMWERKATHGYPKEGIRALFKGPFAALRDRMLELQEEFQSMWWRDFLPRLRLFSVCEEKDNLLMWSHYAKYHTGVVFEFRVMPELDNPLCVAKPVHYRSSPPALLTWKEFFDHAIHRRPIDQTELLQYAYFKSDVWSYEKEWRVFDLLPTPEKDLFSFYPLREGEIEAVYFGCRIDPVIRARLIELLARHPSAALYQGGKSADYFGLSFISM